MSLLLPYWHYAPPCLSDVFSFSSVYSVHLQHTAMLSLWTWIQAAWTSAKATNPQILRMIPSFPLKLSRGISSAMIGNWRGQTPPTPAASSEVALAVKVPVPRTMRLRSLVMCTGFCVSATLSTNVQCSV